MFKTVPVHHFNSITMNISAQGWNDLLAAIPIDPRSIIANAQIGATIGSPKRSTTALQSTWGTNTIALTGNASIASLDSTDAMTQILATQWATRTKMVNVGTSINNTVSKFVFMKAGPIYDNSVELSFGASFTDVQLTLRDNLATSGSFAGSATGAIPVYSFAGSITGTQFLHLTFLAAGTYSLVLIFNNAGTYSTFEMECVVL